MFKLVSLSLAVGCWLTFVNSASAQKQTPLDQALRHIEAKAADWGLSAADVADLAVSDEYQSRHNGVTHLYFVQRQAGIEVHNAIAGVHIKDGNVIYATQRLQPQLAARVNAVTPVITPGTAIVRAASTLDFTNPAAPRLLERQDSYNFTFEGGAISHRPIPVKLVYQAVEGSQELRLAWDLSIDQTNTPDYWSIRVDAMTGEILDKNNWTIYCSFDHTDRAHGDNCRPDAKREYTPVKEALRAAHPFFGGSGTATYNVFPLPVESPIHGERKLVTDPHDLAASPFGWHDTNGEQGPEHQITRGNNVHAYLDVEDNNTSTGDEPNGGADLVFDYYFDLKADPDTLRPAAVTQLFYMTNMMHDFTFAYGFDEESGNFQQKNYTGAGRELDKVLAEAQDGGGTDNANFATPPDGGSGRMQMYLWSAARGKLLTVLEPEAIAGAYATGTAGFGPLLTVDPIIGQVVEAFSSGSGADKVCGPVVNADEVAGKIALINRGDCFFEDKVRNAEAAGAIAAIICNYEENTISMGGVEGTDPSIPSVMLKNSDCLAIRDWLEAGVTVQLALPNDDGPDFLDGDFDNGIIAHEFGHGISNRLTGGPSAANCLNNDEQMGEGWSDFFALVTTVKPGDVGAKKRGIGNFAISADVDGGGIRRLPYSTDMSINTQTYDDIIGTTSPHQLGEIWAGALWDLYWAFVDAYGFDEDQINGTGGNNMAIRLVMDGMKFQACNPSLIDGRDAILVADFALTNGANECLIWEVFSRRGLGYEAEVGSTNDRNDGRENFVHKPECIKELKIAKSATPLIQPGETVDITITVNNHKDEGVSNVMVTDEMPEGLSIQAGSLTGVDNYSVEGSNLLFDLGEMAAGEERVIKYRAGTSEELASQTVFYDGMEENDFNWVVEPLQGVFIWDRLEGAEKAHTGAYSWFVPNEEEENDQVLRLAQPITVTGDFPVLRFYHRYDTEPGLDGGIVQVSTDGGTSWEFVNDQWLRNGYRGKLAYTTFATPGLRAFWGDNHAYTDTYLDLRPYLGQEILVQFRFGSDAAAAEDGWYIDDIEVMDLFRYQSSACVNSAENDYACAEISENGIFVNSNSVVNTEDLLSNDGEFKVYPNPTHDLLQLAFTNAPAGPAEAVLTDLSGRAVLRQAMRLEAGAASGQLRIGHLPSGLYVLQLRTAEGIYTAKVSKQ